MANLPLLDDSPQGRACGACSLCCDLFPVPELAKDGGERCRFCNPPNGCQIHQSRPPVCRSFDCAWLRGAGRPEDRPDQVGYFIAGTAIVAGRMGTVCYGLPESTDGALPYLRDLARRTGYPVFLLVPPAPGYLIGAQITLGIAGEVAVTIEPPERFSWRNARPAEGAL